ncbi:MAG: hypothetical protein IPL47_00045 [Phyllobacteriaceae bacterium]|nr:hypothetical protein [Phyllobacteriaceae bacterium]
MDQGYASLSLGYGWLHDVDNRFVPALRTAGSDKIIGLSVGYLHQAGKFVAGAEGAYQYQHIVFQGLPVGFPEISADEGWMVRGRVGVAHDRWLATANVGAIYGTTNIGMKGWGAIAGASVDYLMTANIFAGVAYDHQFYRNFSGVPLDADIDQISMRIGYKF